MDRSRSYMSPSLGTFLAEVLDDHRPAGAAAFAADILGEPHPANTAAFAAQLLREYSPDQPRDERGRWTTGISNSDSPAEAPPRGTRENGYNGLGSWGDFKTEQEYFDFLGELLKADQNHYPEGWQKVARRGCIGLNMLRIGWSDVARIPYVPFTYPDAEYYADRGAAEARLRELQESGTGKDWLFVAAQMPLRIGAEGLAKKFGKNKANISLVLQNVSEAKQSDYNYATWFPCPGGNGYWEHVNHASVEFNPKDPPRVYHTTGLPTTLPGTRSENVLTLYGVVSRRLWKK